MEAWLGIISPEATLHSSVRVARGAVVLGPSVVERGVYIGEYALIGVPRGWRECCSMGSRIGEYTRIAGHAVIYEGTVLGSHVRVGHHAVVREGSIVGDYTLVGSATIIDGKVRIGKRCMIQSRVYIPPGSVIGDNVFIGPAAVLTNDRYPPSARLRGVHIGDDVVIGAGAVLIAGVRIGRGAVVAAGAVVVDDVDPYVVVAGVPARPIGYRSEFEAKKRLWEQLVAGRAFETMAGKG